MSVSLIIWFGILEGFDSLHKMPFNNVKRKLEGVAEIGPGLFVLTLASKAFW